MNRLITATIIILLNIFLFPQEITYVKGKVVSLENGTEVPQKEITVLIENTGDRDKTNHNGLFKISLNKKFKPGDRITFAIEKEGWIIQYPFLGEERLPSDTDKDQIKLRIVQRGSLQLQNESRLNEYLDYLIDKKLSGYHSLIPGSTKPDLESLIHTLSGQYGFTVTEWRDAFDKFFNRILKDTSGLYEKGTVEFARENFEIAGGLFKQSANVRIAHFRIVDEDFKKKSDERKELINKTIRDLRLAGESYFEAKNYDSSLDSYKNAIEFLKYAEDWEALASTLNKVAICYYYLSLKSYDESIFQLLDSANSYLRNGLDLTQRESLEEWEWKFKGNLETINGERLIYSNNSNKSSELFTIIRNLEIVEENRKTDLDSKDKLVSRNNIGVFYHMLYEFSEGINDAEQYLDSANSSYASIINDSALKLDYPLEWTYVVNNFSLSSIDIGFNKYSIPTYFQMLALRISDLSDISFEDNYSQKIDTTYINSLNVVYAKLLEVEKITNNENKTLELASVLNFIASLRIQLMIYSIDYSTNNFIQITDSIISVASDLATRDDFFPEKINSIVNKGALDIVKVIHNKIISKDEVIHTNTVIENLLNQDQILKLFETYLKRILMLNCFLLSNLVDDPSQKNIYRSKAYRLNNEIIENYNELSYYREFEEAIRIQKIITNQSN